MLRLVVDIDNGPLPKPLERGRVIMVIFSRSDSLNSVVVHHRGLCGRLMHVWVKGYHSGFESSHNMANFESHDYSPLSAAWGAIGAAVTDSKKLSRLSISMLILSGDTASSLVLDAKQIPPSIPTNCNHCSLRLKPVRDARGLSSSGLVL